MNRIVVIASSMLFMRACCVKDATDKEILEAVNLKNPCGTSHGWAKVWRTADKEEDQKLLPIECASDPERVHLMINC